MINFAPCASAKKVPYISLIHIILPGNCFFFLAKSAFSAHPKIWELLCSSCCLVYTFWIWDIQKQIQSSEIKIGRRTWIKITIHIILFQMPIVCHLIPLTYFNQNQKDEHRLSDQRQAVDNGQNPLPIYVAINLKSNYSAQAFRGNGYNLHFLIFFIM